MECAQVVMVPAQTLHHNGHNQVLGLHQQQQHQHQPHSVQFDQHQNQAANVHSHYTMQPVMPQQQQLSNHQQHQIQFNNNNHPTHHHQHHHHHHQQQQPQRPDGRHQTVATNNHQHNYQRQQQHQGYSPLNTIGAPPTPPSDETSGPANCVYLPLHQQHVTETASQQHRTSTGQWVLQQQQQVVSGPQPASGASRPTRVVAQLQPSQLAASNQNQAPAGGGHGPQQTTIASYFYDIDDGFSDIMSAPPTPEPAVQMIAGAPQLHNQRLQLENQHNQKTAAQVDNQQQQLRTAGNLELNDYHTSYLTYGAQQQHHQQHQQQHQHQQQVSSRPLVFASDPIGHYTAAMSPDSLSTTSSSPSDHSLYQLSPPMPTSHNHQSQQRVGAPFGYLKQGSPALSSRVVSGLQQQQQHREPDHQPRASPPVNQQQHNSQVPGKAAAAQLQLVPADIRDGNSYRTTPIEAAAAGPQQPLANCNGQLPAPPQSHRSSPIHLWEFLKELLQQVDSGCADVSVIRWLDRQKGVFKIEDSVKVAKLWGKRKNKPKMNYDKLSRSIRQYYKKGIMKKTDRSQRLVYQFCSAYCH